MNRSEDFPAFDEVHAGVDTAIAADLTAFEQRLKDEHEAARRLRVLSAPVVNGQSQAGMTLSELVADILKDDGQEERMKRLEAKLDALENKQPAKKEEPDEPPDGRFPPPPITEK